MNCRTSKFIAVLRRLDIIRCWFSLHVHADFMSYQRTGERLSNPPQSNQEPLIVRDKDGRPQVSWREQVRGMWCFSLQCFDTVGWATWRTSVCKKLGVGLLLVTIWLELCTTYSSSCHQHFHHPIKSRVEKFWYRLTRLSWKMAVKLVSCH